MVPEVQNPLVSTTPLTDPINYLFPYCAAGRNSQLCAKVKPSFPAGVSASLYKFKANSQHLKAGGNLHVNVFVQMRAVEEHHLRYGSVIIAAIKAKHLI